MNWRCAYPKCYLMIHARTTSNLLWQWTSYLAINTLQYSNYPIYHWMTILERMANGTSNHSWDKKASVVRPWSMASLLKHNLVIYTNTHSFHPSTFDRLSAFLSVRYTLFIFIFESAVSPKPIYMESFIFLIFWAFSFICFRFLSMIYVAKNCMWPWQICQSGSVKWRTKTSNAGAGLTYRDFAEPFAFLILRFAYISYYKIVELDAKS